MRRSGLALFVLFASAVLVRGAAGGAETPRSHMVSVDDYFSMATPMEAAISPDGRRVAYAEARWQKSTNDRKTDLWVVDCQGGKSRRLTMDRIAAQSLQWSADSKAVYYLGQRKRAGAKSPPDDGTTQLWCTTLGGGQTRPITRVAKGIAAYQLDPRAGVVYYLVNVPAEETGPFARLKKETTGIEYDDGPHEKSQLYKLDLQSWREEKLLDNGRTIRAVSLAPEGKQLALITTPDDTFVTFEGQSRVEVFDLASRKSTVLPDKAYRADAPSRFGWLDHLAFGAQGRLAFNVIFDGYPAEVIVGEADAKSWRTWKVRRPDRTQVRGYGSPLAWGKDNQEGMLFFLGEKQTHVRLCAVDARKGPQEGAVYSDLVGDDDDVVVDSISVAGNEGKGVRLAAVAGTSTRFREICLLESGKKLRPLTNLNPQTATWKLPKVSTVSWPGVGGDTVNGVLEMPADARADQPIPLVVAIHGGPTTAAYCQMDFDTYLGRIYLPARGYAVLCPNYRGSTGNGDKFLTDLVGKENDVEVNDILKGVDALVKRKVADPARLGVMGWSNGGYLTNCLISTTTRFKAASSGAGIVDTVMEWGSNDEPAYMNVLKGGLPWDKPDVFRRTSPTYQLNKIRTPTLIHVGEKDPRCPPSHSRTLYRALKLYNKVPTELLTYEGEPHGLGKYANRHAKMTWDLAWFDRYILGKKD